VYGIIEVGVERASRGVDVPSAPMKAGVRAEGAIRERVEPGDELVAVQKIEKRVGIFWKLVPIAERLLVLELVGIDEPVFPIELGKLLVDEEQQVGRQEAVDHGVSERLRIGVGNQFVRVGQKMGFPLFCKNVALV